MCVSKPQPHDRHVPLHHAGAGAWQIDRYGGRKGIRVWVFGKVIKDDQKKGGKEEKREEGKPINVVCCFSLASLLCFPT